MRTLLIFLQDFAQFEVPRMVSLIGEIPGVKNCRHERLAGSVFECFYSDPAANDGHSAIVRIDGDADAISLSGPNIHTFGFAFALQARLKVPLRLSNTSYEFDVQVSDYSSAGELEASALG